MKHALLAAILLMPAFLPAQDTLPATTWLTDFAKAKAASKEKGHPIFAYFTGSDWQKYCLKFQADVLEQKAFLDWAQQNVVLLMLDRPQHKQQDEATKKQTTDLMAAYKITGFPTIVVLDAEGKVKARLDGLVSGGPSAFFKEYHRQLARAAGLDDPKAKDAAAGADEKPEVKKYVPNEETKKYWSTGYSAALEKAKAEKKIVLAQFTDSDSEPCQMLRTEVFDKSEFLKWAEKRVVLLELDFQRSNAPPAELKQQNEKLQKDLKVESLPAILFLDSKGKLVGKISGFRQGTTVEGWIKDAEKQLAKAK